MAGFSLDISGVKQIEQAIKKMDKAATEGLMKEMDASALNIQKAAKRRAPGFDGKLRQSLMISIGNRGLSRTVVSTVKYAPYVEFGTRSKVQIPPGYEGFAAQFKGRGGGTFRELFDSMVRWVKKKNLAQITNSYTGRKSTKKADVNYLAMYIAWLIIRHGVRPQPFLIPSYEEEKPKLIKRLKNLFK